MFVLNPRWLLALVVPVLLCAEMSTQTVGSIAVYVGVEKQATGHSLDVMKQEVETLLRPAGIHVDWRLLDGGPIESHDHGNLFVVRVRGTCSVDNVHLLFSELGPYGDVVALGSASTVDNQVQPFGSLECDPVRRSLAESLCGQPTQKRDAMFGKVMGRIMAHELFHMMTGQIRHADHGLFRSSQRVRDLATREYTFNAMERKALREAVVRPAAR